MEVRGAASESESELEPVQEPALGSAMARVWEPVSVLAQEQVPGSVKEMALEPAAAQEQVPAPKRVEVMKIRLRLPRKPR